MIYLVIVVVAFLAYLNREKLKPYIHTVKPEEGSNYIRIGGGRNKGQWFFRIDLWYVGYRISKT